MDNEELVILKDMQTKIDKLYVSWYEDGYMGRVDALWSWKKSITSVSNKIWVGVFLMFITMVTSVFVAHYFGIKVSK